MLITGCEAGSKATASDAKPTATDVAVVSQPGDAAAALAPPATGDAAVLDASVNLPVADAAVADTRAILPDATAVRDAGRDGAWDSPALAGGGPPSPWKGQDIGAVSRKGDTTPSPYSFIVMAGGTDIGGGADSFHFVYQPLVGDGEIVARVAALGGTTDPGTKAGVMIRAGLEPDAANVLLAVLGDPALGGRVQSRASKGATTNAMPADAAMRTGLFLRLARVGKTVTAYRSTNRATWTSVASIDLELSETAYLGLATEAHSTTNAVQATYNYATIDNLAADPANLSWEHLDVGTLGGTATFTRGKLALTGFGEPFTTAQDHFTGVMQSVSGSQRLTALLDGQSGTDAEAQVGLMFREGLTATVARTSAYAFISVSRGKGVQFQSRSTQGGLTMAGARRVEIEPPIWLRIEKAELGAADQFAGYYSTDGVAWTLLDTATFSAAEPLLMGVVAGAGSATTMNTAQVTGLSSAVLGTGDGGAVDGPVAAAPDSGTTD